jgi:hypothetical protein
MLFSFSAFRFSSNRRSHTNVSSYGRYNRTKLIHALIKISVLKLEIRVVARFNKKKISITHTHTHTHTHIHTNTDYISIERSLSAVYNESIPSTLRDITKKEMRRIQTSILFFKIFI